MQNSSSTYRFFVALIAVALIAGAALPGNLLAHIEMGGLCNIMMNQEQKTAKMEAAHCDKKAPSAHNESLSQQNNSDQQEGCTFTCDCRVTEVPVQPEAVPAPVTAKVLLPVATVGFTVELQSTQKRLEMPPPLLSISSPPIFLINSTFLN